MESEWLFPTIPTVNVHSTMLWGKAVMAFICFIRWILLGVCTIGASVPDVEICLSLFLFGKNFVFFLFFYFFFIKVTLVYNITCFMCTTVYFYFCIHYSVLTTKNLASICHHIVDSHPRHFTHFLPPTLSSSGTDYSLLHVCFSLVCSSIFVCFRFHI